MNVVVDASVAIKWAFEENLSADAVQILTLNCDLFAPDFIIVEICNTIWKKVRRNEIPYHQSEPLLFHIRNSLTALFNTQILYPGFLHLSNALDHPVYDCVYLALAEAQGSRVVTADRRFYEKVKGSAFSDLVVWIEECRNISD